MPLRYTPNKLVFYFRNPCVKPICRVIRKEETIIIGNAENLLLFSIGLGGLLHEAVDFLNRSVSGRAEGEVNHTDVRRGNAEGHAGERALGRREHFAHDLGGARGRGDDVDRGRPASITKSTLSNIDDGPTEGHSEDCPCNAADADRQFYFRTVMIETGQ
jgi:hypothetical protein